LGYLPERTVLSALEPAGDDRWRPLAAPDRAVIFCGNSAHNACNWLLPADGSHQFCGACRLNRTIPNLDRPENLVLWQRLELAKHRMVYGLLRLGLPLAGRVEDPAGLAFDFLADPESSWQASQERILTGHDEGLITINIAEADDAERERRRQDMAEPYRTLLGHFRHEVGHYFWDRLVRGGPWHEPFREMFGDERQDYGACLDAHHAYGPPADWQQRFVSAYASAHPWEDWAETWAHYLHLIDLLETAANYRMAFTLPSPEGPMSVRCLDPYKAMAGLAAPQDASAPPAIGLNELLTQGMGVSLVLNSLNRSLGQEDAYPFVLTTPVLNKLAFVHEIVQRKHTPTA
jgi:hypothetical protein